MSVILDLLSPTKANTSFVQTHGPPPQTHMSNQDFNGLHGPGSETGSSASGGGLTLLAHLQSLAPRVPSSFGGDDEDEDLDPEPTAAGAGAGEGSSGVGSKRTRSTSMDASAEAEALRLRGVSPHELLLKRKKMTELVPYFAARDCLNADQIQQLHFYIKLDGANEAGLDIRSGQIAVTNVQRSAEWIQADQWLTGGEALKRLTLLAYMILVHKNISCYRKGAKDYWSGRARVDHERYGVPVVVTTDGELYRRFVPVFGKGFTYARETIRGRVEYSIEHRHDIYQLSQALRPDTYEFDSDHWHRFAMLRQLYIQLRDKFSQPLTPEDPVDRIFLPMKSYWIFVDICLARLREKVRLMTAEDRKQEITVYFTQLMKEDNALFPVKVTPGQPTLTQAPAEIVPGSFQAETAKIAAWLDPSA